MPGTYETATEKLLRELRNHDRLFGMDSMRTALRDYRSTAEKALDEARNSPLSLADRYVRNSLDGLTGELERVARGLPAGSGPSPMPAPAKQKAPAGADIIRSVAQLGPLIRKARKAMKLNQSEFAIHAGVGRRFLSELESGKPSLEFDKVLACAAAAGIDLFAQPRNG